MNVAPAQYTTRSTYGTPSGRLDWIAHPRPHPTVPASTFWTSNQLAFATPQIGYTIPALDITQSGSVMALTGGYPLPGTAPQWTPGSWPPVSWPYAPPILLAPYLIPNPTHPDTCQLGWDIAQAPHTATRTTGRGIILPCSSFFNEVATVPATNTAVILVAVPGCLMPFWGPMKINKPDGKAITILDIMNEIYTYFHQNLLENEVHALCMGDTNKMYKLFYSMQRRLATTGRNNGLSGFDLAQGLRRVDILGDIRAFWGLWITYSEGTWCLNLGLKSIEAR